MSAILIISTCPSEVSAQQICSALLKSTKAACIQTIGPINSQFHWSGAIESASEYQLQIKALKTQFKTIETCIIAHHPYDVPEIIAIPIVAGHSAYLQWLTTAGNDVPDSSVSDPLNP